MMRPWLTILLTTTAMLAGCSSSPEVPEPTTVRASNEVAAKAIVYAKEMLGKPYKYAGDTPAGFDCSGLVKYSYGRAGISMPRDTQAQHRMAVLVPIRSLREGDLLFFDQEGKKKSHVGMYLGGGRFSPAPPSGGNGGTRPLQPADGESDYVEGRSGT